MLKTGLGRGLGDLMGGQGESDKAKKESGPLSASGKIPAGPGLGAYLRPGKIADASVVHAAGASAPEEAAVETPPAGIVVLSLALADAILMVFCGSLLWNGAASTAALALAAAAFLLAAWCGCLACWMAFSRDKK